MKKTTNDLFGVIFLCRLVLSCLSIVLPIVFLDINQILDVSLKKFPERLKILQEILHRKIVRPSLEKKLLFIPERCQRKYSRTHKTNKILTHTLRDVERTSNFLFF